MYFACLSSHAPYMAAPHNASELANECALRANSRFLSVFMLYAICYALAGLCYVLPELRVYVFMLYYMIVYTYVSRGARRDGNTSAQRATCGICLAVLGGGMGSGGDGEYRFERSLIRKWGKPARMVFKVAATRFRLEVYYEILAKVEQSVGRISSTNFGRRLLVHSEISSHNYTRHIIMGILEEEIEVGLRVRIEFEFNLKFEISLQQKCDLI